MDIDKVKIIFWSLPLEEIKQYMYEAYPEEWEKNRMEEEKRSRVENVKKIFDKLYKMYSSFDNEDKECFEDALVQFLSLIEKNGSVYCWQE